MLTTRTLWALIVAVLVVPASGQEAGRAQASGGVLIPEQACYDVRAYRLELAVDPEKEQIEGVLTMRARATADTDTIVLDLDDALQVGKVEIPGHLLDAVHEDGRIRIPLTLKAGTDFKVSVTYGGKPRRAPNPPWQGGFTWAKTKDGKPWIATSCQGEGADLWWPCKDHPSDKPETMDLFVTVPSGLVCAANGHLVQAEPDPVHKVITYHWHIGVPISNYCVALNIAPYSVIERVYESTCGDKVPVQFFALSEDRAQAEKALPEFLDHLHHMEEVCGPYPFRGEKYGIAETPHLGMEHQTIIAYGNKFRKREFDYDWLHHHEMSHEWWGNLVTCRDWKDMWIHEGIGTYMQGLYIESRRGRPQYLVQVGRWRRMLANQRAVAPRETMDSKQIYFGNSGNDIYYKGACVLHTLRFLVGDDKFFVALRRLAYPDPALEKVTDGSCVRFEDTEGVRRILEEHTGMDLGWFFEVYLRQPALPTLMEARSGGKLTLRWLAPNDLAFPMPVPVKLGDRIERIEIVDGKGVVELDGQEAEVDPEGWLLRAGGAGGRR
ncbi:MAG: M1 family metallopeptidase [Planctomycetota bacterium]